MPDPAGAIVARKKPYYAELVRGRTYHWCACGRSRAQPFCDGSHRGTGFEPVAYTAATDHEEVLFCGCKHSRTRPFCDGAHNNLSATYDEDDTDSPENRRIGVAPPDATGKALLDGGCFTTSIPRSTLIRTGMLSHRPLISAADGARHQAQFYLECARGGSPVLSFGARDVVLFVGAGSGTVTISGRRFAIGLHAGAHVRPGEAFALDNEADHPLKVFAAACPLTDRIDWPGAMPENFDDSHPRRVVAIDPDARQRMGDRFFQMLVDKRVGSTVVTQFIGEIPKSKAVPHRHLYEESLFVMRGHGFLWTETRKAAVAAGDAIFLPRKQLHSLECTDPGGMLVAGVIYPGDNPSINY